MDPISIPAAPAQAIRHAVSTDWAVVVGIDHYPGLTRLNGPENDAKDFVNWLQSPVGGDVPPDQLRLILSSQFAITDDPLSAEPVVSTVDRAFRTLVDLGRRGGETRLGRRLTIFLAGHGFTASERSDFALLTAEALEEDLGFHIPGRSYAEWFVRSGMFEEIVLYMDSCADSRPDVPLRSVPWGRFDRPSMRPQWFYAFAASWGQQARERHFSTQARTHGIFSRALIDGLGGSAANEQGLVTTDSLRSFLLESLPRMQQHRSAAQQPVFEQSSPMVLASGVSAPLFDVVVTLPTFPPISITDAYTGQEIESEDYGPAWRARLRRGLYRIHETDGPTRRQAVFEVLGDAPVTIDAERLLDARY